MTQNRNDDIRLAEEDAVKADLRNEHPEPGTVTDDERLEAAEIRADIEDTRLEMGGTLNQLGNRLEPSHLVAQAKENVREATIGRVEETAKGMSDMVMDTIKRNPIPAAMAGAGLALLWNNRSSGNGNGHGQDRRYSSYYGTGSSYGQHQPYVEERGVGERVGEAASTVGDTIGGAAGQVGETVGRVGKTAGQTVGQVGQSAGESVGQLGSQLDRLMQAGPLAMGAIALGAGAVIGSLLPGTPKEREVLGDASRQLGSAVSDTVDEVANKAEEAIDRTEEKVSAGS